MFRSHASPVAEKAIALKLYDLIPGLIDEPDAWDAKHAHIKCERCDLITEDLNGGSQGVHLSSFGEVFRQMRPEAPQVR